MDMGRPERPIDPTAGPLQQLAYELRRAAGGPSYRQLSKRARYSVTALSEAAGDEVLPTLAVTLAYVAASGGDGFRPVRERQVLAAAGRLDSRGAGGRCDRSLGLVDHSGLLGPTSSGLASYELAFAI